MDKRLRSIAGGFGAFVWAASLTACAGSDGLPASGSSDSDFVDESEQSRESGEQASRFAQQEGYIDSVTAPNGGGEIAFLEGPLGNGIVIAGVIDAARGGLALVERLAAASVEYDATPLEAFLSLSRTPVQDAPELLIEHHYRTAEAPPRVFADEATLRPQAVGFWNGYSAGSGCWSKK